MLRCREMSCPPAIDIAIIPPDSIQPVSKAPFLMKVSISYATLKLKIHLLRISALGPYYVNPPSVVVDVPQPML